MAYTSPRGAGRFVTPKSGLPHATMLPSFLSARLKPPPAAIARSSRYFAMDFVGAFVVAQAEKDGMTKAAVACPFGEARLANEHWQQPGAAAHLRAAQSVRTFRRQVHKWADRSDELLELPVKGVQGVRVETCSHF